MLRTLRYFWVRSFLCCRGRNLRMAGRKTGAWGFLAKEPVEKQRGQGGAFGEGARLPRRRGWAWKPPARQPRRFPSSSGFGGSPGSAPERPSLPFAMSFPVLIRWWSRPGGREPPQLPPPPLPPRPARPRDPSSPGTSEPGWTARAGAAGGGGGGRGGRRRQGWQSGWSPGKLGCPRTTSQGPAVPR